MYRLHFQLPSHCLRVGLLAFVMKNRAARHDFKRGQLGKAVVNAFGNPVAEIIGVGVVVQIFKRENGDRLCRNICCRTLPGRGGVTTNEEYADRQKSSSNCDVNPGVLLSCRRGGQCVRDFGALNSLRRELKCPGDYDRNW